MAKIHIRKHLRLRLIRIPKSPATNSPVAPMTKKSNVRIILGCLLEESHSRGLRGLRRMAKSEITHKSEIYCILSFRLLRSWLDVIMAANITHSASLWPGKFCSAGTLPFCHFFSWISLIHTLQIVLMQYFIQYFNCNPFRSQYPTFSFEYQDLSTCHFNLFQKHLVFLPFLCFKKNFFWELNSIQQILTSFSSLRISNSLPEVQRSR